MKKTIIALCGMCMAIALTFGVASCSKEEAAKGKAKTTATSAAKKGDLPNVRYVRMDSLQANYNLCKDFSEELLRMSNNYQNAQQQLAQEQKNSEASIKAKMQNNQYKSEKEYNDDMARAQQRMQSLAMQAEKIRSEAENFEGLIIPKALNDSVVNFINDYNKKMGYDGILFISSPSTVIPELDITDEVIKGLNERYNKVKK